MKGTEMGKNVVKLAGCGVLLLGGLLLLGLLLTHVLLHGPVGHLDDAIERSLFAHRTPRGRSLAVAGMALADPLNVKVGLAVLVVALAIGTRRLAPPLFLAVAVGFESALYFAARSLIPRDRPDFPRFGPADPVASFPSGHSAAAVCLYGGLAVLAWRLTRSTPLRVVTTALAVTVPLIVGFSRMYGSYHHLTDIVAGLLLGGTWLWLCTRFLLANEGQRWSR